MSVSIDDKIICSHAHTHTQQTFTNESSLRCVSIVLFSIYPNILYYHAEHIVKNTNQNIYILYIAAFLQRTHNNLCWNMWFKDLLQLIKKKNHLDHFSNVFNISYIKHSKWHLTSPLPLHTKYLIKIWHYSVTNYK